MDEQMDSIEDAFQMEDLVVSSDESSELSSNDDDDSNSEVLCPMQ